MRTSKRIRETFTACPHCGAMMRTWDEWLGCTLWVPDEDGMEPKERPRYCPACGRRMDGGKDGN